MKLLVVFGTRPEVIKLAPVLMQARQQDAIELITCSTGQHREMLDQALSVFSIEPDIDLQVMQPDQSLSALTARLMENIDRVLIEQTPDCVMVQGDTQTAFCTALCAFYRGVDVAHVEAGLRTHDIKQPFPEELNRTMIAKVARWHFAPTTNAAQNLLREGVANGAIYQTGNTAVDAINIIRARWTSDNDIAARAQSAAKLSDHPFVLITAHRRENFTRSDNGVMLAVRELATRHPDIDWVLPMHRNPQVRQAINLMLSGISNLRLIAPLDFEIALYLQSRARLILTDSGGIQEEAPSFATPVVVMREDTERTEGIDKGFSVLAGTDAQKIVAAAEGFLAEASLRTKLKAKTNPYGDGRAAERIVNILVGLTHDKFHG